MTEEQQEEEYRILGVRIFTSFLSQVDKKLYLIQSAHFQSILLVTTIRLRSSVLALLHLSLAFSDILMSIQV